MKKYFLLLLFLSSILFFSESANANYWLIIGTNRQGPRGRPEVSVIRSPSLHSIPMKDLETCNKVGKKITIDIYKPVWQFDSKGLVNSAGIKNKIIF